MAARFYGLWPALVTPMTASGLPNLEVVEQLVDRFAGEELEGLYVTGSTGQWPLLTLQERQDVLAAAVKASKGRMTIMAHVGAMSTQDSVALAKHAAEVGADAVSSVAPVYYSYSIDVLFKHYEAIGAATNLPLYVYHYDPALKVGIKVEDYAKRLLAITNIAGMKVTSLDLYLFGLLKTYTEDKLKLFSGADELLAHAVLSGSIGAIGTFYNLWGASCRKVWMAAKEQPTARTETFMRKLQAAISEVISTGSTWSFLQAAIQQKHGIDIGRPRAPLGSCDRDWSPEDVTRIVNMVDDAV